MEAAGARAAPIIVTEEVAGQTDYIREVFDGVSGVLLPGGGSSIHTSSYAQASNLIYDWATQVGSGNTLFSNLISRKMMPGQFFQFGAFVLVFKCWL